MKRIKGKMRLVVKDSRYLAIVAPEVLIERWVGVWGLPLGSVTGGEEVWGSYVPLQ